MTASQKRLDERGRIDTSSRMDSPGDEISAFAAEIHERLFTLDAHCDTPTTSLAKPDWDFAAHHDFATDGSQCDLPRMRLGGLDAAVFALFAPQGARTPQGYAVVHDLAMRDLERTAAVLRDNHLSCGLATSDEAARRLKREGRRAIFLSLENGYSLGRDAGNVQKFHARGVRMIGFTHMLNNDLADSSTDPRGPEWGGLSPFGREIVAECNRLGIVIDGSHVSDDALRDVLEISRAPIMLSHSSCRAVCNTPRNLSDDLLRALAERRGSIQITALPVALVKAPGAMRATAITTVLMHYRDAVLTPGVVMAANRDFEHACSENPNPHVTVDDLVRHMEHAAEVAGLEHVGFGSDFDGGGMVFEGLRDVADCPNITRALLERGWSERELAQLWGGNALRVFRENAQAAQ